MKLTDENIETLLSLGFGIKTTDNTFTLSKDVLYSVIRRSAEIGANHGTMKTKWRNSA